MATFVVGDELDLVVKYRPSFVDEEPRTEVSEGLVPLPATKHSLEVIGQGEGIWERFQIDKPEEAWIAHRWYDDEEGVYRLEPVLSIRLIPTGWHRTGYGPHRRSEQLFEQRERVARQLELAVAEFNKAMACAEDFAKGALPEAPAPWWRRLWRAA